MQLPKILKTNKRTIFRRKIQTSVWFNTTKVYSDYNYIIYNYISPLYEKTNMNWIKEYIIWVFWLHPNVIKFYLNTYIPKPNKEAFTLKGPVDFIIFLCVTTSFATFFGGSVAFLFILTWIFFFSFVWGNIQDWYRFYTPSGCRQYDKIKNKKKKKSLLKASLKFKKLIILSQSQNSFNESVLNLAKGRWTIKTTKFQAYTFEPINKYKNFLELFDVNKYIIKYHRMSHRLDVVLNQVAHTLKDQESLKDFLLLGNILNLIEMELKSKNYIVGDGTLEIKKVYANDYVYDHKNNMQVLLACYAFCWLPVNQTISIPVLALGPWAVYEEKKKPWYVSLDADVFEQAICYGYRIRYFLDSRVLTKSKHNPLMSYDIPQIINPENYYLNKAIRALRSENFELVHYLIHSKKVNLHGMEPKPPKPPKPKLVTKPKKFIKVVKPLMCAWEFGAFSSRRWPKPKVQFDEFAEFINADPRFLDWRYVDLLVHAQTQPRYSNKWELFMLLFEHKLKLWKPVGLRIYKQFQIWRKRLPILWRGVRHTLFSIIFWCIFLFVSIIIYSLFKLVLNLIFCISKISLKSIKNFFNCILRTFNFIVLKVKKLNKKEKNLKNNKNDKDLFNKTEFGLNWYRLHEEMLNRVRRVVREKLREEKQSDEHMLELRHDIVVGDIERFVKNDWHLIYDYESPKTVIAMKRSQIKKNFLELSDILEYRLIAEQCVEANIYRDNLMDTLIYLCANMETSVSMVDETEYVNDMLNFFCIFPMTSQLETLSLNNVTQCNYFVDNKYQCLNKFKDNLISTRYIKQSEIKNDLIFCLSDQISMLEKVNNNSQLKKLNNKNQLKKVWKSNQNWHKKLKKITQMTWKELIIYL